MKVIHVPYTMEKSQGAACHGYCEFDWEADARIEEDGAERDSDAFTAEEAAAFKAMDAELKEKHWTSGGENGFFHARIGYDNVPSGDVEDYREEQANAHAEEVEEAVRKHFPGYKVEVVEA